MYSINAPKSDMGIKVQSKGRTMKLLVILVATLVGVSTGQWNSFGRTGRTSGQHAARFSQPGRSHIDTHTPVNQGAVNPTWGGAHLVRAAKRTLPASDSNAPDSSIWPSPDLRRPFPQQRQRHKSRFPVAIRQPPISLFQPSFPPSQDSPDNSDNLIEQVRQDPTIIWNPPPFEPFEVKQNRQDPTVIWNPPPFEPYEDIQNPLDNSDAVPVRQGSSTTNLDPFLLPPQQKQKFEDFQDFMDYIGSVMSGLRQATSTNNGAHPVLPPQRKRKTSDNFDAVYPTNPFSIDPYRAHMLMRDYEGTMSEQQEVPFPEQRQPYRPVALRDEDQEPPLLQAPEDFPVNDLGRTVWW